MSHPMTDVFPAAILDELVVVESQLQDQASSRVETLTDWTAEPLGAGGKRIRPLLLLTAFHACGGERLGPEAHAQAVRAAVAIELVHTASLVHDDLMDQASQRRGRPSTYSAHGVDGAILVGDYLFTQAFAITATLPKVAMDLTADACRRLCEGQLREQEFQRSGSRDKAVYLQTIADKTSALLAAAVGIGASIAGAEPGIVDAMTRYGRAIGNAFQILDDVLDVAGDPRWTGKPVGTDYLAGTMSSPFLNHLERGGSLPQNRDAKDFPKVRQELFDNGSVAVSQMEAATHTQAALMGLSGLPRTEARVALERLAELLMERAA
jgi:geranylgeranyl pyrophosphate synthase